MQATGGHLSLTIDCLPEGFTAGQKAVGLRTLRLRFLPFGTTKIKKKSSKNEEKRFPETNERRPLANNRCPLAKITQK